MVTRPSPYPPVAVLRSALDATSARAWLRAKGWDVRNRLIVRLVYRLRTRHLPMVDLRKSWDVAHFAHILTDQLPADAAILDVGSVASELPWVLHMAGFRNLTGCDLDPSVRKMPFSGKVRYQVADVMTAGYGDESFEAVTAVSTIEHGMDVARFIRGAARILKPNGLLCISTDYWPDKIDTEEIRAFSMPWLIFSAAEIRGLVQTAAECGLILDDWDGEIPPARDAPVEWNGKRYTFIALVFRKNNQANFADASPLSQRLLDPSLPSLASLRSQVAAVSCE